MACYGCWLAGGIVVALAAAVRRVCALPPERLAQDIARVLARYRPADFAHAWSTLVQRTARPHPTRAA